jgi:hypothetical protein
LNLALLFSAWEDYLKFTLNPSLRQGPWTTPWSYTCGKGRQLKIPPDPILVGRIYQNFFSDPILVRRIYHEIFTDPILWWNTRPDILSRGKERPLHSMRRDRVHYIVILLFLSWCTPQKTAGQLRA